MNVNSMNRWKNAVVWGASRQFSDPCVDILEKYSLNIRTFVDRTPPGSGIFRGYDVIESQQFLLRKELWCDIDVVIFAMLADSLPMQKSLRQLGYKGDFAGYHNGMSEADLFKQYKRIYPKEILFFDGGNKDSQLLSNIVGLLDREGVNKIALFGTNEVTRYILSISEQLSDKVVCILESSASDAVENNFTKSIVDINAIPCVDAIWITSQEYLNFLDAKDLIIQNKLNVRIFSWDELVGKLPVEEQPQHSFRDTQYHIYPIDIPPIKFSPNLDFLLVDLPARFLGMLPNGLGYVHNILNKIGCNFETVDLDMIFYHRYHSRRLLDAESVMHSPGGQALPLDPWGVTSVEDFWFDQDKVNYFRREIEKVVLELAISKPKIFGISLHSTNRLVANEIIAGLRKHCPQTVIVVGGYDCNNPKTSPNVIADYDYMVIFEAENSLPPLVKALLDGKRHFHIPGIVSRKRYSATLGTPFVPAELPEDLDAVGYPKYEWSDIRNYRNYNGYQLIPITLSRGCRWSLCNFCGERFHWRRRSPSSVADEIEWFAERGGKLFHFNDSDLSGDPDAVRGVCEEVVKRNIKGITMIGQLRVQKGYTREYFDVLRAAGFSNLRYGIDGWSRNTLKLHKKGYTLKMIEDVLGYTKAAGIGVSINLVIGIPGETEKDIDETIDNMIKYRHLYDVVENLNTLILTTASVYWTDPGKFDIVLHDDKEKLERLNPVVIPIDMWYSEKPFIDQGIRRERLIRILNAADEYGIRIGGYADRRAKEITESELPRH